MHTREGLEMVLVIAASILEEQMAAFVHTPGVSVLAEIAGLSAEMGFAW